MRARDGMIGSCLVLVAAASTVRAQVDVSIQFFAFEPATLTIRQGQTVRWTNLDFIEHTATSQTGPGTLVPSGVFDSGLLGRNEFYEFTFEQPGTYHYFCIPHGSGMQGVVIVEAVCEPDLTTTAVVGSPGYGVPNGALNNDDFFYYLIEFAAGNVAVADLTTTAVVGSAGYGVPNGVITNDDFFYYLTIFAAGCGESAGGGAGAAGGASGPAETARAQTRSKGDLLLSVRETANHRECCGG